MKANITNIKRFAVHDGDGIRTTVFFKGCPLKCLWCHNPEAIHPERQLAFYAHKCVNCGKCGELCDGHVFENGVHRLDRKRCSVCGRCVEICPKDALEVFGKKLSVDEIFEHVIKDKKFYDESGGGVTLSGGECLMQADFCAKLLEKLKAEGIDTAVDTCGFVNRDAIDMVLPYTDTFLYDVKALDEAVHVKCTGRSNKIILDNLKYIDECGKRTEIRIPYVPGFNDDQIKKIGVFLATLKCVVAVKLLPYHNYAASKYLALDMENTLPEKIPSADEIRVAAMEEIFIDSGKLSGI